MQKGSLKKAKDIISTALFNSDIDGADALELIININQLLSNYEKDIKVLMKRRCEDERSKPNWKNS